MSLRLLLSAALLLAACARPSPEPAPTRPDESHRTTAAPAPAPPPAAQPPDSQRLFDEALALRKAGDDEAARAKLDELLAASPAFALAALERAQLLVSQGTDAEQAARDAQLAAQALPQNPRAQKVLGQTREEAGDLEGALAAYRRSLELSPDAALRRRVASLLARAGHAEEAAQAWEAIRAESPDDVSAHAELAQLYEKLDRPASAEASYRAALALAPQNAPLRRRLVELLEREGKAAEARSERAKVEQIAPVQRDSRKLRPLPPSAR